MAGTKHGTVFNTFFFDFIRHLKKCEGDDAGHIKSILKKSYKVVEVQDPAHFDRFAAVIEPVLPDIIACESPAEGCESLRGVEVFPGLPLSTLIASDHRKRAVLTYVYILSALVQAKELDDAQVDKVLDVIRSVQTGVGAEAALEDVLDDDLHRLLAHVAAVCEPAPAPSPSGLPFNVDMLTNSKIGSMAKEITEELQLDSLEKPEDLMNLGSISNIVGSISNKIQNKLSTGELKKEELMSEALSFLNTMNGGAGGSGSGGLSALLSNPLVAQLAKSMGGGAGAGGKVGINHGKLRNMTAQDRLRKKLQKKRDAVDARVSKAEQ